MSGCVSATVVNATSVSCPLILILTDTAHQDLSIIVQDFMHPPDELCFVPFIVGGAEACCDHCSNALNVGRRGGGLCTCVSFSYVPPDTAGVPEHLWGRCFLFSNANTLAPGLTPGVFTGEVLL